MTTIRPHKQTERVRATLFLASGVLAATGAVSNAAHSELFECRTSYSTG